ncbi:MAG: ABC transporter permease/substrate-binding protein [Alphaproteobacteria bacterium]
MRNLRTIALIAALAVLPGIAAAAESVVVGSKKFTESVILGEILSGLARSAGAAAQHRRELGGTRVLWGALLKGDIDIYPEYTGTISGEILARRGIDNIEKMRTALAARGIAMTAPLGFNNTYAIGIPPAVADKLKIRTISDLVHHPALRFGFGNEFMDRADGWPGLRRRYGLPQKDVRGLDHDLAYRGLDGGSIDAMDVYTTDAEIAYYGLRLLADDRNYFPIYNSVILYRADLATRAPKVIAAIRRLEGRIDEARMGRMNAAVKIRRISEQETASAFLDEAFGIRIATGAAGLGKRLLNTTAQHLTLVGISLGAAILLSIPLGMVAARRRRLGQAILAIAGIIQTIPTLALFVFMIPLLGIGGPPAVVALFLYSLLPIIRNTHTGLTGIAPSVVESAAALGLPGAARMRLVELPLAASSILAGIKISAVINVGTATLGALIGAGGYGQPILTGIRLDDIGLILEGAIPAAALALVVQGGFEIAERLVVPRGLRLKAAG